MQLETLTSEEIRGAVLAALGQLRDPIQESQVRARVAHALGARENDMAVKEVVLEAIWGLTHEGVLIPMRVDVGSSPGWPWLTLTRHGREVLASASGALPHDPDGYLAAVKARAPLSPAAAVYVGEALATFRAGAYIATISMLGSVAEDALDPLVGSAAAWVGGPEGAALAGTADWKTTARLDKLRKALATRRKALPPELAHDLDVNLTGVADLVRRARNEASHPTGRTFGRRDAFALFQLVPDYLGYVHRLTDWFNQQPPGPP